MESWIFGKKSERLTLMGHRVYIVSGKVSIFGGFLPTGVSDTSPEFQPRVVDIVRAGRHRVKMTRLYRHRVAL